MTDARKQTIRATAAADARSSTEIAEKADAERRNTTADELAAHGRAMTSAKGHLDMLRKMDANQDITNQMRALAAEAGGAPGTAGKYLALTGPGRGVRPQLHPQL